MDTSIPKLDVMTTARMSVAGTRLAQIGHEVFKLRALTMEGVGDLPEKDRLWLATCLGLLIGLEEQAKQIAETFRFAASPKKRKKDSNGTGTSRQS